MQDKIFEVLLEKDDVTWQTIIHELIKSEQINVWDVDVSLLTQRYIETIKKLKELDFRLSGKVLLAAAILLKIKSDRLVGEDILQFERLLEPESVENGLFEEPLLNLDPDRKIDAASLIPRTPQPRKRKVSIYDLMKALEKALEVKKRRVMRNIPPYIEPPKKTKDITEIIKDMYSKIISLFFNKKERLTFSRLLPSDKKEDKVYAFIPLLYLSNQQKIDLYQQKHFGEIEIMVRSKKEVNKELRTDQSSIT